MALHRDIYWVGKQWAVTGYGIQACNQKQKGKFDIEGARLWEDGVLERIRAEAWLNVDDFDKALDVARKHYPEPPRKAAPPGKAQAAPREKAQAPPPGKAEAVLPEKAQPPAARAKISVKAAPPKEIAVLPPPPPPPALKFAMHIASWPAKFVRPWRIRINR